MKLDIFQSDKGDCILLESQDGKRILCDGGMVRSMEPHVAPVLAKLRKANKKIDFAYISHIDQDHISGTLKLLQDELDWRVFEHQKKAGNKKAKQPEVPRPPEIGGIWHNSFGSQLPKDAGPIEDMLAAAVPTLLATRVSKLQEAGEELYDIATSIPEAIKVSRLASPEILGIPLNKLPGIAGTGKLLMARPGQKPFKLGNLKLTIIGPTGKELKLLRKGWKTWLGENKETVEKIDAQLKKKISAFGASLATAEPISLRDWNGIPDHKGVTAPNIASLMFMVEEDGKQLLLTGDSQQDFIIGGLEATGFLNGQGLHIDALKVPHHGSEHNTNIKSAARIPPTTISSAATASTKIPTLASSKSLSSLALTTTRRRALARPRRITGPSNSGSAPARKRGRAMPRDKPTCARSKSSSQRW